VSERSSRSSWRRSRSPASPNPRVSLVDEVASLHLIINLVSSTIFQVVLDPPCDVSVEQTLDTLSERVASWVTLRREA
jgi:hypothetical protein